jgi:hypothetical protein
MRHKSIEMTMSYAKTDDARKLDAIGRLDQPDFSTLNAAARDALPPLDLAASTGAAEPEVSVERLFGTDDLGALEMLGKITFTDRGEIVLVEMVDGGTKVNQPVINPDPETDSPQIVGTEGFNSAPRRTRTYNPLIKSARDAGPNSLPINTCGVGVAPDTAPDPNHTKPTLADPDLAHVVSAWPDLPPHIRSAVLALVGLTLTTRKT